MYVNIKITFYFDTYSFVITACLQPGKCSWPKIGWTKFFLLLMLTISCDGFFPVRGLRGSNLV